MARRQTTIRYATASAVALVCFLLLGAVAQGQDLDELIDAVEAARAEHGLLLDAFEVDRAAFETLLDEIDALKDERDSANTLRADDDLREALRLAQRRAQLLNDQRRALTELTDRVGDLEAALMASVDDRLQELETSLSVLEPAQRRNAVVELNRLTELRNAYQHPLPPVPDVPWDEILAGLDEDVTPEELLATADELADEASNLERHLEDLEARIEALTRQTTLEDRARSAYSEATLFEEGVNTGERPQRSAGSSSDGGGDTSGQSTETEASATANRSQDDSTMGSAEPPDSAAEVSGGGSGEYDDDTMAPTAAPGEGYETGGSGPWDEQDGSGDNGSAGLADPDVGDHSRSPGAEGDGFDETPNLEPAIGTGPDVRGIGVATPDPLIHGSDIEGLTGRTGRSSDSGLDGLQDARDEVQRQLQELRRQRQLLLHRVEVLESEGF